MKKQITDRLFKIATTSNADEGIANEKSLPAFFIAKLFPYPIGIASKNRRTIHINDRTYFRSNYFDSS